MDSTLGIDGWTSEVYTASLVEKPHQLPSQPAPLGCPRLSRIAILGALLAAVLACESFAAPSDIPAGTRLSIRLRDRISSKDSQVGEPVSATLIAPVQSDGKEVIPPGFLVHGAVANPSPAHRRLNHAVLDLRFGSLIGINRSLAFKATVHSVDNGRESVDSEGVIHGLRPLRRSPDQLEDLLMLAAYAHPAVLASLELGRFIIAEEEKPRITYEPGVELWLTLTSPLHIAALPKPEVIRRPAALPPSPELSAFVDGLPLRTATPRGTPSDLVNIMFIGSQDALVNAFRDAGWKPAETLDLKTETQTFFALAYHHSYREGPVSTLMIDGQKPAFVFEKETNTYAKRHHIRIWRRPRSFAGQTVWIGAATHDIGIVFSRKARTFSHSVGHDIDAERLKIQNDLTFTGDVSAVGLIARPAAPKSFQNGTGDNLETDGSLAILRLKPRS
jgi:LssY C-terminus